MQVAHGRDSSRTPPRLLSHVSPLRLVMSERQVGQQLAGVVAPVLSAARHGVQRGAAGQVPQHRPAALRQPPRRFPALRARRGDVREGQRVPPAQLVSYPVLVERLVGGAWPELAAAGAPPVAGHVGPVDAVDGNHHQVIHRYVRQQAGGQRIVGVLRARRLGGVLHGYFTLSAEMNSAKRPPSASATFHAAWAALVAVTSSCWRLGKALSCQVTRYTPGSSATGRAGRVSGSGVVIWGPPYCTGLAMYTTPDSSRTMG